MPSREETFRALNAMAGLRVRHREPLGLHTRFGIGGPARIFAETPDRACFIAALELALRSGERCVVIGEGTNLIVSDEGFDGIVLRFTGGGTARDGSRITVGAGALLQDLVDFTIDRGMGGLETLAGIPGSVGAAVYGNAGAYGRTIAERVLGVRIWDRGEMRDLAKAECGFAYRESVFKRRKDWVILSAELEFDPADAAALRAAAAEIVRVRNEKYPPTMKCAGSIFKNLLVDELPAAVRGSVPPGVIREGKLPAAYLLDQAGAKGLQVGDIRVAAYHANLIYNAGAGTARQLCDLINELKSRVKARFGLELEEEVQYIGFQERTTP